MKAPAFWSRRWSLASLALAPAGAIVGRVAASRMRRPGGVVPPLPVVCVGNFVAGGAGKTPTALAVARLARTAGLSPVFLTRGYGGRLKGPLLVDPGRDLASDVGDEPLLLAAAGPTVVARNRPEAFPLIEGLEADLLVMDDGFQNPSVRKTLSLIVVDGVAGIGNGRVMPAGPLRAPMAEQMPRADAVLILGEGAGGREVIRLAARAGRPVLHARLVPRGVGHLAGRRVFGFAGIGRPEKFRATLEAAGAEVAGFRAFADHHRFTGLEAREILTEAERLDAVPVTTEKDAVRLAGAPAGPLSELAERMAVVGVDCVMEEPQRLRDLLLEARRDWLARR